MLSDNELFEQARRVRDFAHAPYSGFLVGAALVDEHGKPHVGCNVENGAYPLGSCAEANAIAAMVAQGGKQIARIVVVGGADELRDCTPCGGCRQRIAEFADAATRILVLDANGDRVEYTMDALLPDAFALGS